MEADRRHIGTEMRFIEHLCVPLLLSHHLRMAGLKTTARYVCEICKRFASVDYAIYENSGTG